MRRLRILLVEDDASISTLIVELLENAGHDVCATARTETEAIAAAERHASDLMIVDATLRTGSGVSAMSTILRRTAMPHIFMTGCSRQSIPAGGTVLLKPFGVTGLMAALASVTWTIPPPDTGETRAQT